MGFFRINIVLAPKHRANVSCAKVVVVILWLCSLDQPFPCVKCALKLDTNRHKLQKFAQISVQDFASMFISALQLPPSLHFPHYHWEVWFFKGRFKSLLYETLLGSLQDSRSLNNSWELCLQLTRQIAQEQFNPCMPLRWSFRTQTAGMKFSHAKKKNIFSNT